MDNKKIIAMAAGALVAGTLSPQALQAMTDYCDHGTGGDIRTHMLEAESTAPVSADDTIAGCSGGKCPRPKRPDDGKKKQGRYNWRSMTAAAEDGKTGEGSCGEGQCSEGSCGEGSCGEGSCGNGGKGKKPMSDDDKSDEGSCGEGSCGS